MVTTAADAAALLVITLSLSVFEDAWILPRRIWQERYASLVEDGALGSPAGSGQAAGGQGQAHETGLPSCSMVVRMVQSRQGSRLLHNPALTAPAFRGDDLSRWGARVAELAREHFAAATAGTWLANLAEVVVAENAGVHGAPLFWSRLFHCSTAMPLDLDSTRSIETHELEMKPAS
uniref:Uncharacterized protein n=1 Tax=Haptolina brevifila TaxID=156173 RepID=A0A7S2IQI6_9EUKA|mmetsp:Transcript_69889/g.138491  ORF Transcript_69889/g.138491 Transcript_69889/m.138491 type:complete len:177 (+) Transcript_69889:235-765(+)|eukprot:CAMPEP_0174722222 /NCGR_PEP_ID=MMETSP1094-20130205/37899_1 /TAXON_ID=156173 /ORGANISM="Chrysochromulina brevifilum, Strain UTEX LB 985" /LENGTH=176 /DNA_ID=CAMNT_0015923033 /DNA_START=233 /DNA_END=763 /DNA_ORIENTATION=-